MSKLSKSFKRVTEDNNFVLVTVLVIAVLIILFFNKDDKCSSEGFQTTAGEKLNSLIEFKKEELKDLEKEDLLEKLSTIRINIRYVWYRPK